MSISTIDTKRTRPSGPSASYLKLIQEFPLRPIRDEADYDAASKIIDNLAVRGEHDLDPGEQDYLDGLSMFIEAYDNEHCQIKETGTPLEHLKAMMKEAGMKTTDLGKLLGNRGLASLILNGKRELSKTHIRILADRFKVSSALFL